jgi:hypothetical protein
MKRLIEVRTAHNGVVFCFAVVGTARNSSAHISRPSIFEIVARCIFTQFPSTNNAFVRSGHLYRSFNFEAIFFSTAGKPLLFAAIKHNAVETVRLLTRNAGLLSFVNHDSTDLDSINFDEDDDYDYDDSASSIDNSLDSSDDDNDTIDSEGNLFYGSDTDSD